MLLDGRPLRSLALRSVRRHLGLVSQEPVLFATSVAANIGYGKEGERREVEGRWIISLGGPSAGGLLLRCHCLLHLLPLGLSSWQVPQWRRSSRQQRRATPTPSSARCLRGERRTVLCCGGMLSAVLYRTTSALHASKGDAPE